MTNDHLDELLFGHLRRDLTPLREGQTVGEALDFLRSQSLGERIVYFYVVDADGKLVGVVPTRRLLMASPDTAVERIMVRGVTSLPTWATLRDAADMFLKQRLLALPVVDAQGHLHGVADVEMVTREMSTMAERQNAEDVFQLIGAQAMQPTSVWRGFLDRFPWLLCNVGGGLVAAGITGYFESLLDAVLVLALFIPVVLAVSESVGMQSVTLTLQSLHGASAGWRFLLNALKREAGTAVLLGLGCGTTIAVVVWVWRGTGEVALIVGASVAMAMTTAALLGVALPVAFRSFSRDPRLAAGPIVLALTDFATLVFYFNVARWFLGA